MSSVLVAVGDDVAAETLAALQASPTGCTWERVDGLTGLCERLAEGDAMACIVDEALAGEVPQAVVARLNAATEDMELLLLSSRNGAQPGGSALESLGGRRVVCREPGSADAPSGDLRRAVTDLVRRLHPRAVEERQRQLLAAVGKIADLTATSANLAETLSSTVEVIKWQMAYEWVAAYLADSDGTLTLCAVAGISPSEIPPSAYHLGGRGSTPALAAATGDVVRIPDFSQAEGVQPALNARACSELSVPIRDGEKVAGALLVAETVRCVPAEAGPELEALASLLAAAVRGASILRQGEAQRQDDLILAEIGRSLSGCLQFDRTLRMAVDLIGERFKVDRCTISWADASVRTLTTEYEYVNPVLLERRRMPRELTLSDSMRTMVRLLQAGEVLASTTERVHPAMRPLWDMLVGRYQVRSWLMVPIYDPEGPTTFALSIAQTTHTRRWAPEDIQLLSRIADQLALSLRNARLFQDVQQAAAELKAKNDELEAFAYSVSHDLQAPAVSLRGYAALLREQYSPNLDERGQLYLQRIVANTDYLSQLLQDILELSRVSSSREPVEGVALGDVVGEVLQDLAADVRAKGVEFELPPLWPTVSYPRTQLRQVMANLLSNAVKFMGDQASPKVVVAWRRLGSQVEVSVQDNGVGIHPDYHQRIFGAFQRLRTVEVEGSGVGLAIVRRVIERHGGRIRVDSSPGEGATFTFTLPSRALEGEVDEVQEGSEPGTTSVEAETRPAGRGQPRPRAAVPGRSGTKPLDLRGRGDQ